MDLRRFCSRPLPADSFWQALCNLGFEFDNGPARLSFNPTFEGKRLAPIFFPKAHHGWFGAETVERLCDELGVDLVDLFIEANKIAEKAFGEQKRGDVPAHDYRETSA